MLILNINVAHRKPNALVMIKETVIKNMIVINFETGDNSEKRPFIISPKYK